MKKFLTLFLTLVLAVGLFAAVGIQDPPLKATEIFLTVGKSGEKISLMELSKIKVSDFEILTGRHMNFLDKISFKLAQRDLKKSINRDGTIDKKNVSSFLEKRGDGESGVHWGGLLLGFFLGLIGLIISLLVKDDKRRNRIKWTLIGWGIALALILIISVI